MTVITAGAMTEVERLRDRAYYSLQYDGFNPSSALELLAVIVSREIWRDLELPGLDSMLFTPLEEGGLGLTKERAEALIDPKKFVHPYEDRDPEIAADMQAMRRAVKKALSKEAEKHGGSRKRKGPNQGDIIPLNHRGTSESHTLRRLHRDHPELYERVINGELSANAAAIEAGFRKRTATVPVDSPESAVRALLKRFDQAALLAAIIAAQRDSS